jgi:hypothetical protein
MGMGKPNISDFMFLILGVCAYVSITPYFGFRMEEFKSLNDIDDFVSLRRWMVPGGHIELSGREYEDLLSQSFSPLTLDKLELVKAQGRITIYDYVNLIFYEHQVGAPIQSRFEDDNLKKSIKEGLK